MKTAWLVAFITTVFGSAIAGVLVPYVPGLDSMLGKGRDPKQQEATVTAEKARVQAQVEVEEKKVAADAAKLLLEEGKDAEMKNDWSKAVAKYERAAKVSPSSLAPARLAAVLILRQASKSEERGQLDDALSAYERCKENMQNKSFVTHKIEAIEEYQANCAQAAKSRQAGNLRESLSFLETAEALATREGFRSDTGKRGKELGALLSKQKERAEMIKAFVDAAIKRGDLYVAIALCRFYQDDPTLGDLRADLMAKDQEARAAIGAAPDRFPPMRMDEKQTLQTIYFKCDKTPPVIGRIVGENDLTVKMAVKMNDKMVNRMILKSKIDKIDQKTNIRAINDEAAVALLQRAASEWQGQRAYDCLKTVGQLYHEFADAGISANEQAQVKATGLPSGLKALVGKAAAQFEGKCPCCIGSGKGVCPTCKGAQTIGGQRCDNCNHTGKVPCEVCDGTGKMLRKKDRGPAQEEDEATASTPKKRGDGQIHGKGTTKRVVFDMGSH